MGGVQTHRSAILEGAVHEAHHTPRAVHAHRTTAVLQNGNARGVSQQVCWFASQQELNTL